MVCHDRWRALALLLAALLLMAGAAQAQGGDEPKTDLESRIVKLEDELRSMKSRLEAREFRERDQALEKSAIVNLYGDIGLRYQMLFESQTETYSRPEFRLHLGIFGTAFEKDGQRIRYELRTTTAIADLSGKPAPTLAWLPFPEFGARPLLAIDRFLIDYAYESTFKLTLGRFPSPFAGTEMLFDNDYNFQGLHESVSFDEFLPESVRRWLPRLELLSVQGYLAQNNIGAPVAPIGGAQPIYIGAQFRLDTAPFERAEESDEGLISPKINSELEFRFALGLHWYDGEEGISEGLGVGLLDATTNIVANGKVHSDFMIGEAYLEVLFLRSRRARLAGWFHGVFNFHAEPVDKGDRKRQWGFEAGVSWGMERMEERWDFRVAMRYFIVQSDALIPEFNNENINTNIKGFEADLYIQVFPSVSLFGRFMVTEREDYEKPGFGRPSKSDPNHAGGQSLRIRAGIYLSF